ncbi:hypothetical protein GE09DRAFT_1084393 [Coniochaeta sp. 2T2.1]|nr:hypothetical protein GE09DRAFT_1084393 [Coniochaeta sp. 2T2.1]
MPSRLIKSRPESTRLRSDSPRSSRDSERENGLLSAILFSSSTSSSDPAAPAVSGGSTPKTSTPAKPPGRLNNFLHGRKHSKAAASPAPEEATPTASKTSSKQQQDSTPASRTNSKQQSSATQPAQPSPQVPSRMVSIRAVGSFDEHRDGLTTEEESSCESQSVSASRSSAFSSSVNSNASGISAMSQQQQQHQKPGDQQLATAAGRLKPSLADEFTSSSLQVPGSTQPTPRRSADLSRSSAEIPTRESSRTALTTLPNGRSPLPPSDSNPSTTSLSADTSTSTITPSASGPGPSGGQQQWDSTIGKAGLGKTGRVINKLVSDNESLKRQVTISSLKYDEARQKSQLLEDKMERMAQEHESRLLEANVTKSLLARKERQVESLSAAVDAEKEKARAALERERVWKEEMEAAKAAAKQEVEEARAYASMMEGRYNAIASHWSGQGSAVEKAVAQAKAEILTLAEERRKDDEKIVTLREVCDQQDGNIRELTRQKEEIAGLFEKYKAEQENALRDIKANAQKRESEQEKQLKEGREMLDKLKWSLGVKNNVPWAE